MLVALQGPYEMRPVSAGKIGVLHSVVVALDFGTFVHFWSRKGITVLYVLTSHFSMLLRLCRYLLGRK
jgi:hypothetical protein